MIDLDDLELGARLRSTARHATSGVDLLDPSDGGPVRSSDDAPSELQLRRGPRRRSVTRFGLVAAAVVAVLGIVGAAVALRGGPTSSTVDAAAPMPDGVAESVPAEALVDPAQQLRDAVAATLASESFRVRTEAVVVGPGQAVETMPRPSVMPLVFGSGEYGDVVWTVSGEMVEVTHSAGPARSVRDRSAGTTAWEIAPGEWQRASIEEDTVVENLARFAEFTCVAAGDRPDTLVVLAGDAPCPTDLAHDGPRRLRWTVTLRPDGRIEGIRPMRDAEPVSDARSDQHFSDYDTATVELPDPASVTEVSTPEGSSIDSATGYARPMYSKG
jgi:hypothetical protein